MDLETWNIREINYTDLGMATLKMSVKLLVIYLHIYFAGAMSRRLWRWNFIITASTWFLENSLLQWRIIQCASGLWHISHVCRGCYSLLSFLFPTHCRCLGERGQKTLHRCRKCRVRPAPCSAGTQTSSEGACGRRGLRRPWSLPSHSRAGWSKYFLHAFLSGSVIPARHW